jgi:hypothetical protein
MIRNVWQLQKLTVRYCPHDGSSAGVRCGVACVWGEARTAVAHSCKHGARTHAQHFLAPTRTAFLVCATAIRFRTSLICTTSRAALLPSAGARPWSVLARSCRKFLKKEVLDFAKANPQLKVHAVLGAGKHPVAIGSYAVGSDKVIDIKNAEPDHILAVCAELRNTTGRKITKIKHEIYGAVDSVQGKWEPTYRCVVVQQ